MHAHLAESLTLDQAGGAEVARHHRLRVLLAGESRAAAEEHMATAQVMTAEVAAAGEAEAMIRVGQAAIARARGASGPGWWRRRSAHAPASRRCDPTGVLRPRRGCFRPGSPAPRHDLPEVLIPADLTAEPAAADPAFESSRGNPLGRYPASIRTHSPTAAIDGPQCYPESECLRCQGFGAAGLPADYLLVPARPVAAATAHRSASSAPPPVLGSCRENFGSSPY